MTKGLKSVALLLASAAAVPASAQDVGLKPAGDEVASATPEEALAAPTERGIADIVVTATRREERLQQIPVTVTAVAGSALLASGITDTRTLTQAVPALNFSRIGLIGVPVIRGVGSSGVSNGDESNVAIYIDGVYQADNWSTLTELVAVDRVEVLRGPQGTVFGRNATGGLINIITPNPSFTTKGSISAAYRRMRNDSDGVELRGYVTGGLSETIAVDLAGLYRYGEGYVKDLLRGGVLGKEKIYNIRSNLLIKPADGAEIIFTAAYGHQDSQALLYELVNGNTSGRRFSPATVILPTGPWQSSVDVLPIANYRRLDLALRTSFDLGSVRLETTGAYQRAETAQRVDSDSSNISIAVGAPSFVTKAYNQEVRLLSNTSGSFTWLTGVYAFKLTSLGDIDQGNAAPPPGPLLFTTFRPYVTTVSYAAFAEGTLQLAEPLFLTVGGRYTTEKRTFRSTIERKNVAGAITSTSFLPFSKASTDRFTYRAALRYQVSPKANIYGSYATGFKSGVFNTVASIVNYVEPEKIEASELGLKSDLADFLRLNLAAFNYKYSNLQVSARAADGTFILQNAARAKIYGGEAEVILVPTTGLTLTGSVAYTHGRYKEFLGAQSFLPRADNGGNTIFSSDVSGNNLTRAPQWSFIFNPRYETELGDGIFSVSSNIYHASRVYYDFSNNFSQNPYTLVSGEVAYQTGENWRFSLRGTNLTNRIVAQQLRTGSQSADRILEPPRRLTLTAQYKF